MTSTSTLAAVRRDMRALANPEDARFLQRFFKTGRGEYGEGDMFLGIRVPQVRRVARAHRMLPIARMLELLESRWHEERLLALIMLADRYARGEPADRDTIFHAYLANTSRVNNWDLVDASAPYIVGPHLAPDDVAPLERLAASGSIWERRIAILTPFHWIRRGDVRPALHIAALLVHDEHDLIHKAVGWMLREVGKRDIASEEAFLATHYRTMPRTMLRYAIERFPEERRRLYLHGEV